MSMFQDTPKRLRRKMPTDEVPEVPDVCNVCYSAWCVPALKSWFTCKQNIKLPFCYCIGCYSPVTKTALTSQDMDKGRLRCPTYVAQGHALDPMDPVGHVGPLF